MSLLLTLEHGPRSQAVRQARLDEGELVIGRSASANWQIDDPDMYVSRAHCTVSARQDGYFITDTSSSGLFIGDAGSPLGAGNSARLQNGMRFRLGDYIIGVEVQSSAAQKPVAVKDQVTEAPSSSPPASSSSQTPLASSSSPLAFGNDDFFSIKTEEAPKAPRPAGLPDPFEKQRPGAFRDYERADADRHNSPAFDDPFSLESIATPSRDAGSAPAGEHANPFGFDFPEPARSTPEPPTSKTPDRAGFEFDIGFGPEPTPGPTEPTPEPAPVVKKATPAKAAAPAYAPWELPPQPGEEPQVAAPEPEPEPEPVSEPELVLEPQPVPAPEPVAEAKPEPEPEPIRETRAANPEPAPRPAPSAKPARRAHKANPQPQQSYSDTALREAFLRGLGLDEAEPGNRDPLEEMEKFGREYRLMMEGLMQLLRKRAEEKGNARVAQTVIGASEVNPLKFMPRVEDVLGIVMRENSPGFLAGEAAIADSIRDLAQHHVRAWRGVQGALRRMIDRFDPVALEKELKSTSSIGALLTGGKGAKLWELYQKRHREIAQSAETRFLGEIGVDFRDAYEEE